MSISKRDKLINEYKKRKLFYNKLHLTSFKKLDIKKSLKLSFKSNNSKDKTHVHFSDESKILDYKYKESPIFVISKNC